MAEAAERAERGRRLRAMRESELPGKPTVIQLADQLNSVARGLGMSPRWTGPKVSKIEAGTQNLTMEDVAVLAAFDPKGRDWFWWYFGREQPKMAKPTPESRPKTDEPSDRDVAARVLQSKRASESKKLPGRSKRANDR